MRKTLLFLSLLIAFSAGAENYIKEGTTWISGVREYMSPHYTLYEERLERCMDGDEEALGLFIKSEPANEFEFQAFIKTEGNKVFVKNNDINPDKWFLMYDFDLPEDELIQVYSPFLSSETDSRDITGYKSGVTEGTPSFNTIQLCNLNTHPEIYDVLLNPYCHVRDYPTYFEPLWIEGIGSYQGFAYNTWPSLRKVNLIEVISNGETVFYNEELGYLLAGVDITESISPSVRTEGCDLVVTASGSGKPVSVYAADGRLIHSGVSSADELRLTLPAKGIYLVRIGNHTEKVIAL